MVVAAGVLNIVMTRVDVDGKKKSTFFGSAEKQISLSVADDCKALKWTSWKAPAKAMFPSEQYTGVLHFVDDNRHNCFSVLYEVAPSKAVLATSSEGLRFCYQYNLWKKWPGFVALVVSCPHTHPHTRRLF